MQTQLRRGDTIELKVEDLAFGGLGVAHHNGMVVLVERGFPGDTVLARIRRRKSSYLEAVAVELKAPSPERVAAVCQHYPICGGCKAQDLRYEVQIKHKTEQVRQSLIHLGGFADPAVHPTILSPEVFFYRNKMEFSFFTDEAGKVCLGLHKSGTFDKMFDLEKCWLQSELSNEIVAAVRDFAQRYELVPYHVRQHIGFLRFLAIRESKTNGQVLVNLVTNEGEFPQAPDFVVTLTEKFPQITGIVRNISTSRANIATGEREELLWGKRYISEKISGLEFSISANSFFQTNTKQAEMLFATTLAYADCTGSERALDLYSGTGTISLLLAQKVRHVTGIEVVPEAVTMARLNAEHNGITNATFLSGEVRDLLPSQTRRGQFDLVIIDPPRAGLHEDVVRHLIRLKVPNMVYVSCNPATLARDLKLFAAGGYKLIEVQPVDMFPHTPHIECVAKLTAD